MSATTLRAWVEWKRRCALELCSECMQQILAGFGEPIMRGNLKKFDPTFHLPTGPVLDDKQPQRVRRDGWHIFERYMHAVSGRTGKRWKDWLFEKAVGRRGGVRELLEKEACACMWTAARMYCESEGQVKATRVGLQRHDEEVDHYLPDNGSTPNPAAAVDWLEFQEIAAAEAAIFFGGMDRRTRIALWMQTGGVSLGDPNVQAVAGCGRDQLYQSIQLRGEKLPAGRLFHGLQAQIAAKYSARDGGAPGESHRTIEMLSALALEAVRALCIAWGRSEPGCSPLLPLLAAVK